MNLNITRVKSKPHTQCVDCDTLNPEATRSRARQHARNTGHTVTVTVPHVTTYVPERK